MLSYLYFLYFECEDKDNKNANMFQFNTLEEGILRLFKSVGGLLQFLMENKFKNNIHEYKYFMWYMCLK